MNDHEAVERFLGKVSADWMWLAGRSTDGYGSFSQYGRQVRAHRLMWKLVHGQSIPVGQDIMHSCDIRTCVDPAHLQVGSRGENVRDCARKGRLRNGNSYKTDCKRGHSLSGENLYVYNGRRTCRQCRLERQREYTERHR